MPGEWLEWHVRARPSLVGEIAFEILLDRLTNIRLAADRNDFTHTPSFILRGLKELDVEFERA